MKSDVSLLSSKSEPSSGPGSGSGSNSNSSSYSDSNVCKGSSDPDLDIPNNTSNSKSNPPLVLCKSPHPSIGLFLTTILFLPASSLFLSYFQFYSHDQNPILLIFDEQLSLILRTLSLTIVALFYFYYYSMLFLVKEATVLKAGIIASHIPRSFLTSSDTQTDKTLTQSKSESEESLNAQTVLKEKWASKGNSYPIVMIHPMTGI
jgi:hypothetical protein